MPLRPHAILERIQRWERALGEANWPCYVLNNHDIPRSATRWKAPFFKPHDDARLKLAAALLLTLRGTPFIYYGEEIGMRDIPIRRRKDVLDPIGKRFWPVMKGRDGCRSPMQWDDSPAAGFTAGALPWLPVHKNHQHRSVLAQQADPSSLLNFYRRLIALRRVTPALTAGMFQPITFDTNYLLAYLRQTNDQTVLVALNFSGYRQRLVLGGRLKSLRCSLLLSSRRESTPAMRGGLLPLAPYEAAIYALE
jgi:alpha-glucosidase